MFHQATYTRFLLLLFGCLLHSASIYALPESIVIEKVNIGRGKEDNIIYDILQDRQGFLWLATQNGLWRYDGYNSILVSKSSFQYPIPIGNRVNQIHEDYTGKLWYLIGNARSSWVNVYDPEQEKDILLTGFGTEGYLPHPLYKFSDLILEDTNNVFWLRSISGLYQVSNTDDENGYQITSFRHVAERQGSISNDSIHVLFFDHKKQLWIGTERGLNLYKPGTQTFFCPPGTEDATIISICETKAGLICAGTKDDGLILLNAVNWQMRKLLPNPHDTTSLAGTYVPKIVVDGNDNLWMIAGKIEQWKLSIQQLDPENEQFYTYPVSWEAKHGILGPKFLIPSNIFTSSSGNIWIASGKKHFVYESWNDRMRPIQGKVGRQMIEELGRINTFFEDRMGIKWLGGGFGLYKHVPSRHKFDLYLYEPAVFQHYTDEFLLLVYEDREGYIWSGSKNGIQKINLDSKKGVQIIEKYPVTTSNFLQDRKGNLWLSTNMGLKRLETNNRTITTWQPDPENPASIGHPVVLSVLERFDGKLWVGTFGGGLNLFDLENDEFIHYKADPQDPNALSSNILVAMIEDQYDRLWIGTSNRGHIWDPKSNQFRTYEGPGWILDFLEDRNGIIWGISTGNGLYRFDEDGQGFQRYSIETGFSTNFCYRVEEDDNGKFWISSELGLIWFDPESGLTRLFDESDGIPAAGLARGQPCQRKNGELLFPVSGNSGFVRFHPDKMLVDSIQPQVIITDIRIFNRDVEAGGREYPLSKALPFTERLVLRHNQNVFTLEFAALHFASPDKNIYSYKMEGVDDQWNQLGNRRYVSFSGLVPGEYRFMVRAANHDGIWSETATRLDICILAPWWKTRFAYLLYVLGIATVIFGFYKFQLRRKLAEAEATRFKELNEAKSRLYTNISHEFRTPLTLVLGIAGQIRQRFGQSVSYEIDMIRRNGRQVLRLVNQLLDLARVESGALPTDYIQGDIILFLRAQLESFHSLADSKKITLLFVTRREKWIMDYDPQKLQEIITNLVSNAIKFTQVSGKIILEVKPFVNGSEKVEQPSSLFDRKSDQYISIKVKDTGPGILNSDLPFVFDRFFQSESDHRINRTGSGIGLALTKELVKLLNGNISVSSEIGRGTAFNIHLPVLNRAPFEEPKEFLQEIETPITHSGGQIKKSKEDGLSTKKPQLLLVEDNHDLIEYLKTLLKGSYEIVIAENGKKGCEKAFKFIPDIILSDVMMPEMDGFELLSQLKDDYRTSHIPIVLLTAKANIKSRLEGLSRGADAFLAKPFNREELLISLRNLVKERLKLVKRYSTVASVSPPGSLDIQLEDNFIQRLQTELDAHLSDEYFGVSGLGQALAMSRSQLYRKVRALTGKSVNKYIQFYRLHKAKELLQTTSLHVIQAAQESGFKNHSHFCYIFREEFGLTPTEVRKNSPFSPH